MSEPTPILIIVGGALMAMWAVVAFMKPRLAPMCALFATIPGFQIFWAGLGISENKLIRLGPVFVVPAIVLVTVVAIIRRQARGDAGDASERRSA